MTIDFCQILTDLLNVFTGRFLSEFAVHASPHLAYVYVATLPCETLISAKQAIIYKLQGSVATYFRCGGVVNNQIKKGLLLSLSEKKLKPVNIWQSYRQEHDCFVHFLRLLAVRWPTITFLLVTLPNIHRFKKIHSQTRQQTFLNLVINKPTRP